MKGTLFNFFSSSILIVAALFSSCNEIDDCFKSTGGDATENRLVTDFTEISVHDNANVIITQDTVNSVVVEAGDHLLSEIKTTIDGERLTIENDNSCNWVRSYKRKVNVYIHAKNLKLINHFGSESITSTNTIIGDSFECNCWASGDISVSINVKHATARTHVAAGDVTFSGSADDLFVWDICEGFIHCENLPTKSAIVNCKGTGDCYVNISNELTTELTGDGSIYYYGHPSSITTRNTGSGQLVHLQ